MICKNCNKSFHYCGSCGWVPEAELNCCSKECAQTYFNTLQGTELIELMGQQLYGERIAFSFVADKIKENKQAVGDYLVDYILNECGY